MAEQQPVPVNEDSHATVQQLLQRAAADYAGNKPATPAGQQDDHRAA